MDQCQGQHRRCSLSRPEQGRLSGHLVCPLTYPRAQGSVRTEQAPSGACRWLLERPQLVTSDFVFSKCGVADRGARCLGLTVLIWDDHGPGDRYGSF